MSCSNSRAIPLRLGARGLCLVVTDVSEQRQQQELRRTQDALRASEERLELSQRAGHIGSFEWNIETGAVTWSASKEELHGLPVGSFGEHLYAIRPYTPYVPRAVQALVGFLRKAFKPGFGTA